MNDRWHMSTALALARRGLGHVWPNPSVGCVIAREGEGGDVVLGRGVTAPGGRPHAETEALREAGEAASGATAYVTLEPCAHQGKTGPCAEALAAAGIKRAVIAMKDPDPRTNGQGIARLEAAGIDVSLGLMEQEARAINAGFLMRLQKGRPLFTLKVASSLDGRIATATGESRWITGDLARQRGHLLRAQHDAILVGANTARRDNPALTCRLPGLEARSPLRIVLATGARLSPQMALFSDKAAPSWLVVAEGTPEANLAPFAARGATILTVPMKGGALDLASLALRLGEAGLTRVLIEGGGRAAAAFWKAGIVDRIVWFRSSVVIGGDGLAALGDLGVQALSSARRPERTELRLLGDDVMEVFEIPANETAV
jgi:diaminohydroxyphosphoribosylaminopyrimidine deaminase/5-amino-6-(5-phosphoribosylamino)uracil reductase